MAVFRNLLFLALYSVLLSACERPEPLAEENNRIFVSILPMAYFAKEIVGDVVEVNVMVGPGKSPETFEPSPRLLAALGGAKIYFAIDVPFERVWLPKIRASHSGLRIFELYDQSGLMHETPKNTAAHEQHEHDPHRWTSPVEARKMAQQMSEELIATFPEHAALFAENHKTLDTQLSELDQRVRTKLEPFKNGEFVVMHPGWGALAEEYGLVQLSIEHDGKAPTAQTLQNLISHLQEIGVKHVFIQPQHSQHMAETVAQAIGAEIVSVDPLSDNYVVNLEQVVDDIVLALRSTRSNTSMKDVMQSDQHHH